MKHPIVVLACSGLLAAFLTLSGGCNNSVGGYVPSPQPAPLTGEESARQSKDEPTE
ncbi:MAG: hypothetical protein AAFX76_11220 [Planctomycetota bacterium]